MAAFTGFDKIRLRIERADAQVEQLRTATAKWVSEQKLELAQQHDVQAGEYTIWVTGFGEPPPEWGIDVGELAHNLRAAIDNTITQLVLSTEAKPPPDNKLQFPIFHLPGQFPPQGGRYLVGVPQKAIVLIQNEQPYNFSQRPHWLEVLSLLNDVDKHRVVHPTVTRVANWEPKVHAATPCKIGMKRNISDRTVLKTALRYKVEPRDTELQFDTDEGLPLEITFGEGSSGITHVGLAVLCVEVERVVTALAASVSAEAWKGQRVAKGSHMLLAEIAKTTGNEFVLGTEI